MGIQLPLPQRGTAPAQFSAHIFCGQMDQDVTWYGARPRPRRLCVRWGSSPRPAKGGGGPSPIFGPFLLWPNGSMHQNATWYGCWPQPRGLCVRWGPAPSSTCRYNMLNFGLLTAEICWRVWGTPAGPCKFQRLSRLGNVTARHSSSGRQPYFAAWNRGRHLYLAGRPSR